MGPYRGQVINLNRLLVHSFLIPTTIFPQKLVGLIDENIHQTNNDTTNESRTGHGYYCRNDWRSHR
jgi:hypothetical protein